MAQFGRSARLVLLATLLTFLVLVASQNPIEMKIISDLLATESKLFSNRYGRSYHFNVTDLEGSDSSHSLKVGSSKSQGEYKILLPDNRWQIVSYIADEKGYRATVRYETVDHAPISEETQGGSESYWAGSVGTTSPPQRIPGPPLPPRLAPNTPTYYLKPEAPKRDPHPVVSQVNTYVIHPAPDDQRSTYYPPAPAGLRPSPRDPYANPRRPEGPPIVPIKRPPATIGTYRPKPHVGYQVPVELSGLPAPRTTSTTKPDDDDSEIEESMRFNPNQFHPFWEPQAEKPDRVPVLALRPVQRPVEEPKRPAILPEKRPPPPTPPRPEPTIKPHTGYKPAHSGYPKPHSGYYSEEDETLTTKRPVYAGALKLKPSYQVTENYQQTYKEPTTFRPPFSQIKLQPANRPEYYQPPVYNDPPTAVYQTTPKNIPTEPPSYEQPDYYRPHTEPPTAVYQTTSKYIPTEPPSYEQSDYYRPHTDPPTAVYQTTSKYIPKEPPSYEQPEYYHYHQTEPPTAVYQTTPKYASYHARPTPGYHETTTKWSQPVPEQPDKPYTKPDYYREPVRVKPDPYAFDPFDEPFKPTEGPYGNFKPTEGPYGNYRPGPSYEPQVYYQPPAHEQQYEPPSYEVQLVEGYDDPPPNPVVASSPEEVAPVQEDPIPVFDDNRPPPKASFDGPLFYQPSFARGRTSTTTTTPAPSSDFEEPSLLLGQFKFRPKSKTTTSDGFGTRTQPLKRTKGQSTSSETIVYDWQDPSSYIPSVEAIQYDSVDDPYKYSANQYESVPVEVPTKRARKKKVKVKTTTTTTEQPVEHALESYHEIHENYEAPHEAPYTIHYNDAPYEAPIQSPAYPDAEPSIEPVEPVVLVEHPLNPDPSIEAPVVELSPSTEPPTTVAPTTAIKTTTTTTEALTTDEAVSTTSTTPTPSTTKRKRKKKKKGLRSNKGSLRKSKLRSKHNQSTESTPSTELTSSESTDSSTSTPSTTPSTTTLSTTTTTTTTTAATTTKRPTRIRFPPRIKYVAKSDRYVRQHNSKEDDLSGEAAELMSSTLMARRNDDESHVVTGQFDMDSTLNSIPIDRLALVDFDEADDDDDDEQEDDDDE